VSLVERKSCSAFSKAFKQTTIVSVDT
jgi:hypothetical protein